MDPPSPTKFPMSPGMPIFPVSPERVAGTKPLYGAPGSPQQSPMPELRSTSPLRSMHRRNDSDVSSMAAMFENLGVKDTKEAQQNYMQMMQRQKSKHKKEVDDLEKKVRDIPQRYEMRIEELKASVRRLEMLAEDTISRELWDKQRQEHREAISKWEKAMQYSEEKRKQAEKKAHEFGNENNVLKTKAQQYKKRNMELSKEAMRATSAVPTFQAKIQSLERSARLVESDLKFHSSEAEKYKNQVYGLQVDLESVEARLSEEVHTLKDKLRLIEGERDALKASLKEEEVQRIAAEGQIPLPTPTAEDEEFGSPVRSPRKPRNLERDEEDKENVAPRKTAVELKLVQHELLAEKRLRERAQEQIEFMKMECQFRCCSCRIADFKGAHYVHDNTYSTEMERIKAAVPEMTPPSSSHGDDPMEGVITKQEQLDEDMRPSTPPEDIEPVTAIKDEPVDETTVEFSPTTGTFKPIPSPVKAEAEASTQVATPAKPSGLGLSAITEMTTESSPWTPDANSTVIRHDSVPPPRFQPDIEPEMQESPEPEPRSERSIKLQKIHIHEDAVVDDDEENDEPLTPLHGPSGPATPGEYLTRTITTTTTIPLHFSPLTPAAKGPNQPLTPSTVAHAPSTVQSKALGELSLNNLPFDREAALQAIRERRGRARSMAIGHGTPRKQMMEGVKERRDISAPVSRVRR